MKKDIEEKVKYVWRSEGGDKTCDECSSLDGEEFDSLDDAPSKPHPNCKCEIEAVVRSSSPNNPDDTISVKEALEKLGYYKTPEWGITPFADREMYDAIKAFQKDNKLQVDGFMKPDGETVNKINEHLKNAESLSAAGMQGLSLGWSDEVHGTLKGTGYAIGSLNKNWNKTGESASEAFKRGYLSARDEHRNLLEEGQKKMPAAMTLMESAGAIASPVSKAFGASKTAPLKIKSRANLIEAVTTGVIYGVGVSKGGAEDYTKNVLSGVVGNLAGYGLSNNAFGRAGNSIARSSLGEISGYGFKKARNLLEDDE